MGKKKQYAEYQKREFERAKRHVDAADRDLICFPAGKTLSENEDHGEHVNDPAYWWSKKIFYSINEERHVAMLYSPQK